MSSNLFSPPKPKNYRPQKSENLNIPIQPHRSSSAADLSPPSAAAHRRSSAPLLAGLQLRYSPASLVRNHSIATPTAENSGAISSILTADFTRFLHKYSKEWLASSAAEEGLVIFGYNKLEEKKAEKVTKEEGNLLNWGLNGIGAFFSLGMSAATVCIILFGNCQRHKQQKFRIRIYSDDKQESRIQVLLQESLNGNSRNGTKHFLYKQSADVKKQTVFFLQTADVWSTSSAAEACRCGPQTADVLASKKQTPPLYNFLLLTALNIFYTNFGQP
ncbi:hypothetical protein LXL04_024089 [Taraxacum kok-saghyz]